MLVNNTFVCLFAKLNPDINCFFLYSKGISVILQTSCRLYWGILTEEVCLRFCQMIWQQRKEELQRDASSLPRSGAHWARKACGFRLKSLWGTIRVASFQHTSKCQDASLIWSRDLTLGKIRSWLNQSESFYVFWLCWAQVGRGHSSSRRENSGSVDVHVGNNSVPRVWHQVQKVTLVLFHFQTKTME